MLHIVFASEIPLERKQTLKFRLSGMGTCPLRALSLKSETSRWFLKSITGP